MMQLAIDLKVENLLVHKLKAPHCKHMYEYANNADNKAMEDLSRYTGAARFFLQADGSASLAMSAACVYVLYLCVHVFIRV